MAAIEFTIRPGIGAELSAGGFISYGVGPDIDEAFDYAAMTDRLSVGDSGLIMSIAHVDPATARNVLTTPVHPLVALDAAYAALPGVEAGIVVAQAVSPLSDFKHRRVRVVLEDPALDLPVTEGLIDPIPAAVRTAALEAATSLEADKAPAASEELVAVELVKAPRQKFKVAAENIKGAPCKQFAVYARGVAAPLSVHPSQGEAKKAAMTLARAKDATGPLQLEIRPIIGRNDGEPFVRIDRNRVAQKAQLRVTFAEAKRPDKARVNGWVFYGRPSR